VFISVTKLEESMGVNNTIGRFFVDREPPANNSLWKGKLLYISTGNGFINIPVYYDLLFRIGLPIDTLLDEEHIRFMEQLMHYAMLKERNEISPAQERGCICSLISDKILHVSFYENLNRYLSQPVLRPLANLGLDHPSLNRADVFLYILCVLPITERQMELALKYWYRLHPSYLILDDIRDYSSDLKNGDDNIVLDLGGGIAGFEKAFDLYRENGTVLKEINPQLGQYLLNYEEDMRKYIPKPV
jgi:hypothetical protein